MGLSPIQLDEEHGLICGACRAVGLIAAGSTFRNSLAEFVEEHRDCTVPYVPAQRPAAD